MSIRLTNTTTNGPQLHLSLTTLPPPTHPPHTLTDSFPPALLIAFFIIFRFCKNSSKSFRIFLCHKTNLALTPLNHNYSAKHAKTTVHSTYIGMYTHTYNNIENHIYIYVRMCMYVCMTHEHIVHMYVHMMHAYTPNMYNRTISRI